MKDDNEQGQAFMIGKISGCVDSKYENRKIIQMSEYCELPDLDKFKQAWKNLTGGQRYPVAYLDFEEVFRILQLDINSLDWKPFVVDIDVQKLTPIEEKFNNLADVMDKAKEMISQFSGVGKDRIDIKINF